ncbi:hypothetical protein WJ47_28080 [Burkholderia ubonensis]|uniref:DUF2968 domain-containing protein n=1 Tax=Burkholderia ubonensis TaxID=101571 RepID=A0AB73G0B6_9BURK|nr:DUF2968 domain-containing protein [Burkholderia ubonensis]KVK85941.1 hypothetical protein WJ44_03405 [Burkholderia ubonensis]KVL78948.1 hypothetical protein WJ47_28080 [Burkholderia ubonensis]KVM24772.1 hypothetical protein WJ53_14670 [Burkholderia ubonensis]KVM37251.1 hypothetical protein WJ54_33620 [Burkholderia ubonensis]
MATQFAAGAACAADSATGEVPAAGSRPAVTRLTPARDEVPSNAQGDVAQLTQLLRSGQLTEMRTTYNGSYGASMLFYPTEMTYYVALFQDKNVWRVVKSQERPRAEMVYDNFIKQTVKLSAIEIQRTELEAQKHFLERVIVVSKDKAGRLRADLDVAREQQVQVAERQRTTQQQTRALEVENQAARLQLDQLRDEVGKLQRESETGLPTFKPR